jgi:hypothetical protein
MATVALEMFYSKDCMALDGTMPKIAVHDT